MPVLRLICIISWVISVNWPILLSNCYSRVGNVMGTHIWSANYLTTQWSSGLWINWYYCIAFVTKPSRWSCNYLTGQFADQQHAVSQVARIGQLACGEFFKLHLEQVFMPNFTVRRLVQESFSPQFVFSMSWPVHNLTDHVLLVAVSSQYHVASPVSETV